MGLAAVAWSGFSFTVPPSSSDSGEVAVECFS